MNPSWYDTIYHTNWGPSKTERDHYARIADINWPVLEKQDRWLLLSECTNRHVWCSMESLAPCPCHPSLKTSVLNKTSWPCKRNCNYLCQKTKAGIGMFIVAWFVLAKHFKVWNQMVPNQSGIVSKICSVSRQACPVIFLLYLLPDLVLFLFELVIEKG